MVTLSVTVDQRNAIWNLSQFKKAKFEDFTYFDYHWKGNQSNNIKHRHDFIHPDLAQPYICYKPVRQAQGTLSVTAYYVVAPKSPLILDSLEEGNK